MRAPPFAGLRVVLVAAFNPRYHRSGLALAAALAVLGCEVRRCEERRRGLAALLPRPLGARLGALLRRAPADLVLVFKGTKLAPGEVAELRHRSHARWVNWFPDDPHELDVALRLAPAYDCFFTHDSSSLPRYQGAGADARYLAFGCDPDALRSPAAPRRRADLVFVGSRDPARKRVLEALAAEFTIVLRGPGWPAGPVYGAALGRALSSGAVGLNIHQHFGTDDPARYGSGANMRVFELACIGTPQLSDAKADIARHFTPDREIVLYRSVAELRERARALLTDERLRASLAAAARRRALGEHTWAHRLEELLTVALR